MRPTTEHVRDEIAPWSRRWMSTGGDWFFAAWLLFLAAAPPLLRASDPPHWTGQRMTIDCTTQCHTTHQADGGAITTSNSNVNLCQSCHNSAGLAGDLPIDSAARANGSSGMSHAYDVAAVNPTVGTQVPVDAKMSARVYNGNIVCSTCHNQHLNPSSKGGTPRAGVPKQTTALGSTGVLSSGGAYSGLVGSWYLLEVTQAGTETTAQFKYSKDNGVSWFPAQPAGVDVPLDSGLTVTFGVGSYVVGERWELYGAWPFLRVVLDDGDNATGSKLCRDCHANRVMDHTAIETYDGTERSHPVGVLLGVNLRGYDRGIPLDASGGDQGGAGMDGNPTNDLVLDSFGNVQCFTCHGMHYADGNSLTQDGP